MNFNSNNKNSNEYVSLVPIITYEFVKNINFFVKIIDNSDPLTKELLAITRDTNDMTCMFLFDNPENKDNLKNLLDKFTNLKLKNINNNITKEINKIIYKGLSNSFVSLLKVIKINQAEITVKDLLSNKIFEIRTPNYIEQVEIPEINDILFARIANFSGYDYIVNILEYFSVLRSELFIDMLPPETGILFKTKKINNSITRETIKNEVLNLYITSSLSFLKELDILKEKTIIDDMNTTKQNMFSKSDLKILDPILSIHDTTNYEKNPKIRNFLILKNIYDFYFVAKDYNFSDFKKFSIKEIIEKMCQNGYFLYENQLVYTIGLLNKIYETIGTRKKTDKILEDIDTISKNIFSYIDILKKSTKGFYVDSELLNIMSKTEEENFTQLYDDFDTFLSYIDDPYAISKNNELIPSQVRYLASDLEITKCKDVKNLKQRHFLEIDLFYKFAKHKEILKTVGNQTIFSFDSYIYNSLLELSSTEVIALFIHSFVKTDLFQKEMGETEYEKLKNTVHNILKLSIRKDNELIEFINSTKNTNNKLYIKSVLEILKKLNLINIIEKENNILHTEITDLGKNIYLLYNKNDTIKKENNIINFKNYRKLN